MIREMPVSEKPREKALRYGIRSLSSRELLAIVLRSGQKGKSVLEVADEVLEKAGGISGIARMSIPELNKIHGVSDIKALELQACFEIARRCALEEAMRVDIIDEPEKAVNWLQKEIGSSLQEQFLVIYLDQHHRILFYRVLFVGTINASNVYPREIFREALLHSCTDLMLVHNHPGNDPTPSQADLALTRKLQKAGRMMGVRILDHLIVTGSRCLSLKERGFLEEQME
ncbi:MAG: DNA repair protein RadC [Solobacterium sp.]|nr:DNA repair protein RadC [Solobacterium sp.]